MDGRPLLFDTVDKITRRPVRVSMRHMFHALLIYANIFRLVSRPDGLEQKKPGVGVRTIEVRRQRDGRMEGWGKRREKEKERKRKEKKRGEKIGRIDKKTYIYIATFVRYLALSVNP